jgi:SAM-dependent methyltransferase
MNVTKDGPQRSLGYRFLRAAFRTVAPDSLIVTQRVFRKNLASVGLKSALRLRADAFFGKYLCPVCARRVAFFSPIDSELLNNLRTHGWKYQGSEAETCNHRNYSCPHCGATDRDRLYALYLTDYLPAISSCSALKLVDFAPSPPLSDFIRKLQLRLPYRLSYVTADLFRPDVDDKVDITDMKIYKAGSFDFFICSHILEHVEDDKKALAELYRILKQGGKGILVVPIILTINEIDEDPSVTDPSERWRRFGQFDHVRLYSKPGFLSRVEQAGFITHHLDSEYFGKETFTEHGITEQSVLYIVEKR